MKDRNNSSHDNTISLLRLMPHAPLHNSHTQRYRAVPPPIPHARFSQLTHTALPRRREIKSHTHYSRTTQVNVYAQKAQATRVQGSGCRSSRHRTQAWGAHTLTALTRGSPRATPSQAGASPADSTNASPTAAACADQRARTPRTQLEGNRRPPPRWAPLDGLLG